MPEVFDPSVLDGKFLVTTAESIEALRELTATEGIFAGVSSGGVLAVARRLAEQMAVGHASLRCSPTAAGNTSPRMSGRATLKTSQSRR